MPNFNGVWSLTTQLQYKSDWPFFTTPTALIALGQNAAGQDIATVETVRIDTTGNSTSFGDLSSIRAGMNNSAGSTTRGLFAGGNRAGAGGGKRDVIDFMTFASAGNATDFGNLAAATSAPTSLSNSTRFITGGGRIASGNQNVIQYVTIASEGNSSDFGDLTEAKSEMGSTASPTRGLFFAQGSGGRDDIEYVTIASTGNATDFGNMTVSVEAPMGVSSNTRGLHCGGSGASNVIGYVTIASTGNATDFGDLSVGRNLGGGTSSQVRGFCANGSDASGLSNVMDFFTIATLGNASDFGDTGTATQKATANSAAHGGLSL